MTFASINPPQSFDTHPRFRFALAAAGGALTAASLYAVLRWLLGYAPATPWAHDLALAVHLASAIPAIPLGAYVLFRRKGGPRHRRLGRVWLGLMTVTAVSTLFIRNVNDGDFSWLHLFTLLTFIAVPRAILSARAGRIDAHKRQLLGFYIGALLLAGATAFAPGRTMWQWALG